MQRLLAPTLLIVAAASPLAAQTRYIAFGDSITNGVGFDDCACQCPEECGYAARLQRLLEDAGVDAVVENQGLGGERTPEGLTRLDEVLADGGDVLLLMEGTNDISRGISPETTAFNLNQMAEKAEAAGLAAVHATLIPRIPTAQVDSDNAVNRRLAWDLRDLAFRRDRDLTDPFEVFSSTTNAFADLYSPAAGDPVGHPNPEGYDLLAGIFADVLLGIDSVPPVPGLAEPADGAEDVPGDARLRIRLFDFGDGIDLAASTLLVDGAAVPTTRLGDERILDLVHHPAPPLSGVVDLGYRTRDLALPANTAERTVARFLVEGTVLLAGDLDRDGRVDGIDLVRLALAFGAARGDRRYDGDADVNSDGIVDGEDLAVLASNFGQSAS